MTKARELPSVPPASDFREVAEHLVCTSGIHEGFWVVYYLRRKPVPDKVVDDPRATAFQRVSAWGPINLRRMRPNAAAAVEAAVFAPDVNPRPRTGS